MKWLYILVAAVLLMVALSVVLRIWVSHNLEDIINRDPERKYEVSIEKVRIQPFWQGITMRELSISPKSTDSTTTIRASVEMARLNLLHWSSLLFRRQLEITSMEFIKPGFVVDFVPDTTTTEDHPVVEMRRLFGDILSRASLHEFSLVDGIVEIRKPASKSALLTMEGLNIRGINISTDSMQWQRIIPFAMDTLTVSFDSLGYEVGPYSSLTVGPSLYSESSTRHLTVQRLALPFDENVSEVSRRLGIQKDLITFTLDSLTLADISILQDSNAFAGLKIQKMLVNSLQLQDYRDKTKPRPTEPVKPLFAGMIRTIPFPIVVDSILVENADIAYSERPEEKEEFGTLQFIGTSAAILRLTNIREIEEMYQSCEIQVTTRVNKVGMVKGYFRIPYDGTDRFAFKAEVRNMPMHVLNSTLHPLAGILVHSGNLVRLDFAMEAAGSGAQSHLIFDYEDLKLDIMSRRDKRSGLTWLANPLLRTTNLPDHKNYRIGKYTVQRNVHRGPFNLMWNGLKEGLLVIIPSGTALKLAGDK